MAMAHLRSIPSVRWLSTIQYIKPTSLCMQSLKGASHTTVWLNRCTHFYPRLLSMSALKPPHREFHCMSSVIGASMLSAKEKKVDGGVRKGSSEEHGSVLMQFVDKKEAPKAVTVGAKAIQAGKDVSYVFVILAGFAVTGFLLWSVGSEFFMSDSPSAIFTKALKRVKADPRVVEALGEPITGHGEHSGRGRRRHIANQEYIVDGVSYMRVKFYVDGSRRKGTAFLDLKKNDRGKYECRFLFVELQGYPAGTIVLEDNR